jgi:hypothetical protein
MATELLAIGTAAAVSADFDLVDGDRAHLFLKDDLGPRVPVDAVVKVQIKSVGGQYFDVAQLGLTSPTTVLDAAGTYRLSRAEGSAVGVDRG